MVVPTLYDILGVTPSASADRIERAYQARMRVLSPEVIGAATPWIHSAADRARAAAEDAWQVLCDPAERLRYDQEAGLRRPGEGLASPRSRPSERPGLFSLAIDAITGIFVTRPRPSRKVTVPDVRGLFAGLGQHVTGSAGLRLKVLLLTARPMPVEGLIVDQTPLPDARVRRGSTLTVMVWHPTQPARELTRAREPRSG